MNATEPRRRGRPPRANDEAASVEEPTGPVATVIVDEAAGPPTPNCPRCARPSRRSTRLLKAYDMSVLRCDRCRIVAIEGDAWDRWYDEETARAGSPPLIATRAAVLYTTRRSAEDAPAFDPDGFEAAICGDWGDPRWTEIPS